MTIDKDNENTVVTAEDLVFLKEQLSKDTVVVTLHDLAMKLAYRKNASQLGQEVKVYDPNCVYQLGDLIYKEYDEQLLVSSKGMEHFKGAVVLKVVNKISYDSFNCEMLEVDFTGGGSFRKHIDYMKKSKTQVLLPSALEGHSEAPPILKKDEDPRMKELPMTEKDLRALRKNLGFALTHSKEFFNWKDSYQLAENQVAVDKPLVQNIEAKIRETKKSHTTSELAEEFLSADPKGDDFALKCISLNATLDKKHKKSFAFISSEGGGKWFLKETLESMLKDLPLAKPLAKLPSDIAAVTPPDSFAVKTFPFKVYLTWREVFSGGIAVPKNLVRELSESREYQFVDAESKEQFTTYFYPTRAIFVGLKDFYQKNSVTQGASLTLERGDNHSILFSLKKAKKSLTVPFVSYDAKKDRFSVVEEEIPTSSLPNKIIFLESDTLKNLENLYPKRTNSDLRDLLILIFQNFGLEGEALSLHIQRAYHLVDILRHTTLLDVEKVLDGTPEFFRSEKKKGLFLYKELIEPEEEAEEVAVSARAPLDMAAMSMKKPRVEDDLPAIGTVGEIETPTVVLHEKAPPPPPKPTKSRVAVQAPVEEKPKAAAKPSRKPKPIPEAAPAKPDKEEKPKKKKRKAKPEVEKAPRRRKGERRIIEERIELEESELEALIAVKAEDVTEDETLQFGEQPEEAPVEYKPKETEKSMKGVFGDMLKSALSQKGQDQTVIKGSTPKKTKAKKSKKEEGKT